MIRYLTNFLTGLFGYDNIKYAYRKTVFHENYNGGLRFGLACLLIRTAMIFKLDKLFKLAFKRQGPPIDSLDIYGIERLHVMTNDVYKQHKITVDPTRPVTINVLVPAFANGSVSAGFFGVFQVAKQCAQLGYHVRLLLFDLFDYNPVTFQELLKKTPGLEDLFDLVEIDYVGDRDRPIKVSPHDMCVATVWYSAYLAENIRKTCNQSHFLYLIQDYEPAFHAQNSTFCLADHSYEFPYKALFSSKSLMEYCVSHKIVSGTYGTDYLYFNNAATVNKPTADDFARRAKSLKRRLVFYSRPMVNRNMFELGAMTLISAYQAGIFDTGHNWEFAGMGMGNGAIQLDNKKFLMQVPRMSLEDYQIYVKDTDLCLTLMSSPHPSMIPMDIAGSGGIVLTNTFRNKNQDYFDSLSGNIISAAPHLDALLDGMRQAVQRVNDWDKRLQHATMDFPTSWDQTWNEDVTRFLNQTFSSLQKLSSNTICTIATENPATPKLHAVPKAG